MNRNRSFSLVDMFKWFWGRLRQWVRRVWGNGKPKGDNATGHFDQEKALSTRDTVPHGGTPETTQANNLSDGHPSSSVLPNEARAGEQRAPSAGDEEISEKVPIDDRQLPSESEQSNTQFGDHGDDPDGQLHPESKQENAQVEDHHGQEIDDGQLLSKQKNVPSGDHRDKALDDGNDATDATAIRHLPEEPPTVDYTTHEREPVVEENVTKHVHTVYELERTRSTHVHEHFYHIQPVIDTSDPKEEDVARG
ncbi:hypothetical protein E4U34_006277 [Claviceps purpurea]|nr:hypothetical protein E4U51_006504 [Claviceps purpurea]KAG6178396.1 hypothetical protein E4U27_003757 [Claviceps purpurea]KAG6190153.1 hypothetical protein E4U10_004742 [Claviceps purpurea]KAG6214159.1 hypothetical protein E4U34_006277 [Claviceps purpurea]